MNFIIGDSVAVLDEDLKGTIITIVDAVVTLEFGQRNTQGNQHQRNGYATQNAGGIAQPYR